MLRALLNEPRTQLVAVLTPSPSQARGLAGAVDLAGVARAHGVPVHVGLDLRSESAVRLLDDLQLDLLVVVGWTRLVPAQVLALPRRGCVGFHASMLPQHRGRAPVNWAIIRGERATGATMLMLDAGADTGVIIDQRPIAIADDDTCATVYRRVAQAGVEMLRGQLDNLLRGCAPARVQCEEDGDVLPKRTPQMGITDWNRTVDELHNWIRALTYPYPGAFSLLDGSPVRLWRAEPGRRGEYGLPGSFVGCDGDGLQVAARDGTVRLLRVEQDGREEPAARWFEHLGKAAGSGFDPVDPAITRWALGLGPPPDTVGRVGTAVPLASPFAMAASGGVASDGAASGGVG
jgi:methionyl-tRNA formyltransferase